MLIFSFLFLFCGFVCFTVVLRAFLFGIFCFENFSGKFDLASGMPYMYVWICVCINIYVHFWFPFSVLGFWRACVRAWLGCYAPCLSHLLVCLLVLVCFVPGLGGIHANICGSVPATVVCTCTCASVHPFSPFDSPSRHFL